MKKGLSLILTGALFVCLLAGCGTSTGDANSSGSAGSSLGTINVISREDGSGTRGAFVELLKIEDAGGNDATCDSAEITNSTSVMMTTVAGNKAAIGYASLGSLSSDVKAVSIDGVEATVDNIKAGTYTVARPFNIVYKEGSLTPLAQDFMAYILSTDGQKIINQDGYIGVDGGKAYTPSKLSGTVTLAGSTSVSPLMEKLADAYKALNPNVTIEIQQSGSSAGITSATDGVCDFGMSSRELTASEASALTCVKIATDGIAVIVNKDNDITNLTKDQVKQIFMGETTNWSDLSK